MNRNQWLLIAGVVLSVSAGSAAYFTGMFGADTSAKIVGTAAYLNAVLQGIMIVLTGQGQQVKDVLTMPGVEKISVNALANQTLAQIAVDPRQDKIAPTEAAEATVAQTAKGN